MEILKRDLVPRSLLTKSLGPTIFLEESLKTMSTMSGVLDENKITNKEEWDAQYDLLQSIMHSAFALLLAVPPELKSEIYTVPPNIDGLITVDSPKIFRVTYRHGGFAQAQQISRYQWELQITSSDARGKRLTIKTTADHSDKKRACAILGNMASDAVVLRKYLNRIVPTVLDKYKEYDSSPIAVLLDNVIPAHEFLMSLLLSPTDEVFSRAFEQFQKPEPMHRDQQQAAKNLLGVAVPPPDHEIFKMQNVQLEHWQMVQIIVITLHDIWLSVIADRSEAKIEEMTEMVKNGKEKRKVWYLLTGGDTSISKLVNTLSSNRHFIVLDTRSSAYLNVQFEENKFVKGVADRFNCKIQLVSEAPDYNEALCGKFSTNVHQHGARCNACDRVRKNQAMAEAKENARIAEEQAAEANLLAVSTEKTHPSTSSPDGVYKSGLGSTLPQNPVIPPAKLTPAQEIAENNAKNGPVTIIQAPTPEREIVTMSPTPPEGIDPTDFQGLASYYTDLADQHQKAAHYYADLALRMEEFLREPEEPESVRLAREALEKAVENAAKQREEQFDELKSLLTGQSQ